MDEKDREGAMSGREYVSHGYFHSELDKVNTRIDEVDRFRERDIMKLETMFSSMDSVFSSLNSNMSRMADNQEETNKEIRHLGTKTAEHELMLKYADDRMTASEKRQSEIESQRVQYRGDVWKLVLGIVTAIISTSGGIIAAAFHFFK